MFVSTVAGKTNFLIKLISKQTIFEGNGFAGYHDGDGIHAKFNLPEGVAIDKDGNIIVAERNHRIRKISYPNGFVTTIAGTGVSGYLDGDGIHNSNFNFPEGVVIDKEGNIFIADCFNHRIRKINSIGKVTSLAGNGSAGFLDGPGIDSSFDLPSGVAIDKDGNIFVADSDNNRIRKVSANGVVTTVAGNGIKGYLDGKGINSSFYHPRGVAIDKDGNLFVSDFYNYRIRKVSTDGVVTTVAGDGTSGYQDGSGINSKFSYPSGLAMDKNGNLFIADSGNNRIRKLSSIGLVTTIAGDGTEGFQDGNGINSKFNFPIGLAVDKDGCIIFVADYGNNRIRQISVKEKIIPKWPSTHSILNQIDPLTDLNKHVFSLLFALKNFPILPEEIIAEVVKSFLWMIFRE